MSTWANIRFADLFDRVERKLLLDDSQYYNCVGVRWYGMGAFIREKLLGGEISRKQQWIIQSGDVVYNKLFAWKGAFAMADKAVDGCIVSDKFPTYRVNTELVDPRWLGYYFKMPLLAQQAEALSKGAAAISKLTLNPPQFWELSIPLPPLVEQRRIAARLEKLSDQIHEACGLRQQAIEESEAGRRKFLDGILLNAYPERKPLRELLAEPLINGLCIPASRIGSGVRFAKVGVVNTGRFNPKEMKLVDVNLPPNSPYWLRYGDIVVSRGNSIKFVGRSAVYVGEPPNCAIPDLLIRVRLSAERADARFVSAFFHSSEARDYVESQISGTSSTMPKISQSKLEELRVPVPPLPEQRRIVAEIDALHIEMDALKRLQSETATELDALLPSVLDQAFKGEL